MGWSYRKSMKAGPFRINLSKRGVGYSVGGRGYRVTRSATGRTRRTVSIPGTGIRHTSAAGSGCLVAMVSFLVPAGRARR